MVCDSGNRQCHHRLDHVQHAASCQIAHNPWFGPFGTICKSFRDWEAVPPNLCKFWGSAIFSMVLWWAEKASAHASPGCEGRRFCRDSVGSLCPSQPPMHGLFAPVISRVEDVLRKCLVQPCSGEEWSACNSQILGLKGNQPISPGNHSMAVLLPLCWGGEEHCTPPSAFFFLGSLEGL